ncbi:MAG: hypothetical protein Q9200_004911, partial [Gallowayella weberi]
HPKIHFVHKIIHDVLGNLLHIPLPHPPQPTVLPAQMLFPRARILGRQRPCAVMVRISVSSFALIVVVVVVIVLLPRDREIGRWTPEIGPEVDLCRAASEDADGGEITEHAVVESVSGALLRGGFRGGGQEGEEVGKGGAEEHAVLVDFYAGEGEGA